MAFGVVFPDRSSMLTASTFTQVDPDCRVFTQVDPHCWVLDLTYYFGPTYHTIKVVCIFLVSPASIPVGKALAVYAQAPGQSSTFCGAVHAAWPSAVFSLPWADEPDAAASSSRLPLAASVATGAKLEIVMEDFQNLPTVTGGAFAVSP